MKPANHLKAFTGVFVILLLVASNGSCQDISSSVVKIYSGQKYACAGYLVEANFVVTSAECFQRHNDAAALTVEINEAKFDNESSVVEIFIPEEYNRETGFMDVAVLKLNKYITGPQIKPEFCSKDGMEFAKSVTFYYWHLREEPDDLELKTLELTVVKKMTCGRRFEENSSYTVFFTENPKINSVTHDVGGPAFVGGKFCGINNYYDLLLGKNWPGSFTSVANSKIFQFITESLKK